MSRATVTLQGTYFDGLKPLGSPATLVWAEREAALIGEQVSRRYALVKLIVSPRIGKADRFITLPDGGQLQCPDHPLLDRLPHEVGSEGVVAWLEQRLAVATACIALVIGMLAWTYLYALPVVAEKIAMRIPLETERKLGIQTLAWLDEHAWFEASHLSPQRQALLRDGFRRLYAKLPQQAYYRLEFRNSTFIGPNAFALPGGTIVITDAMVALAEQDDEIMAVLAHEIGHVELRHTMRQVIQGSITAAIATTVAGDAASLSAAVAGLPAAIAQAKYSRAAESEADAYAFRLLRQRGLSAEAFAALMERVAKKEDGLPQSMGFLSSHPTTRERIKQAHAAASAD